MCSRDFRRTTFAAIYDIKNGRHAIFIHWVTRWKINTKLIFHFQLGLRSKVGRATAWRLCWRHSIFRYLIKCKGGKQRSFSRTISCSKKQFNVCCLTARCCIINLNFSLKWTEVTSNNINFIPSKLCQKPWFRGNRLSILYFGHPQEHSIEHVPLYRTPKLYVQNIMWLSI